MVAKQLGQGTFLFQLNETPPFQESAYGLQWVMVAIPNVIVFSALGAAPCILIRLPKSVSLSACSPPG
jgi:hypothetical protein